MKNLHLLLNFSMVTAAFLVPFSNNPINSIIFLIITFFNAALILFFFNVEFLGIIYIIVYVGAIAVLFLFVIMMLNIKSQESFFFKINKLNQFIFSFAFFYTIFLILLFFFESYFSTKEAYFLVRRNIFNSAHFVDDFNNIDVLGQVLFNHVSVCFLISGIILLVALIGSIVLTLEFKKFSKKQSTLKQLSRSHNTVMFLNKK